MFAQALLEPIRCTGRLLGVHLTSQLVALGSYGIDLLLHLLKGGALGVIIVPQDSDGYCEYPN